MKILVITDLYPVKEDEKYTPKTIYSFVKGWEDLGHEVRVIKPNFLFNSFLRGKPFYKSGIYGKVENVNYFLPFLGDVSKKIKTDFEPDITVAHMPSGLIVANKLGRPFVAGVHISDLEVLTNPVYSIYFKPQLELAYKNASKIACRSEVLRQKFLKLYPEYENKTFVAFSGIDKNLVTKRYLKKEGKYKVITCANLIRRKNVDKVILACEKFDNLDLTVIGDGKEFARLKSISNKPNFLGHLSNEQVLEKMRESDIFILPSENETFGMVYLEAMAAGCITVGLKNDGIDGIIKDGVNGFLTEKDRLENTIERILNSDNLDEILENSYNTILNYTKEAAAINYSSFF